MLIDSNDLREELKKPVWLGETTPEYEKGWRDACAEVEKCILHVEDEQRYRYEIDRLQNDLKIQRISQSAEKFLSRDPAKLKALDSYYAIFNHTVDLETMPLKDVPIGGVVIEKFVNRIDAYIKTSDYIGEEDLEFEMIQIYSSQPDTLSDGAFFSENAKVVYTGFRIKDWRNLL